MTDIKNPLQDMIKSAKSAHGSKSLPPVHLWNPPYCGDIGMEIHRDGTWFYGGSPIGRKPLVKLFSSILRHDDDGKHYLVTPAEKILVHVEDAPFIATLMTVSGAGETQNLQFTNNVGDTFQAGADNPMRFEFDPATGEPSPYVLVRAALEALIARAVFYDLVDCGVAHEVDGVAQFGVWSGGLFFPMMAASDVGA